MRTVAVRAGRVHVGFPGPVYDDAVVLIEDGVVREIGPSARVAVGNHVNVLDARTAVVVPGLIDAHVHLALGGTGDPAGATLDVPEGEVIARMVANGRLLPAAGVTTARDLGAPTEAALAARAALRGEGGLRLLVAGAPITAVGAHLHFFGGGCETAEQAIQLVRQQAEAGVDWIKLVLSGGEITPGSSLRDAALPEVSARAAVGAAHQLGLPVAVHAHTAAAARLAVALDVQTVEHCTLVDADPGDVVAPAVVCPTANARWLTVSEADFGPRADRLAALRSGGTALIAGTDAGIPGVSFGAYADGLLALHRAGLSPGEVLAAASSRAAEALGLSDRGSLDPGKLGDLVALDGDPLRDLSVLRRPRAVVVAGRPVAARGIPGDPLAPADETA